jgi:hypothetical protein
MKSSLPSFVHELLLTKTLREAGVCRVLCCVLCCVVERTLPDQLAPHSSPLQ